MTYGYAWKTTGGSGYECFDSAIDRDNDLAKRLRDSPEPKPITFCFEAVNGNEAGEAAIDKLFE